jgi:hypothetical protein
MYFRVLNRTLLGGVVAFGVLGVPLAAYAQQISLLGTAGGVSLTGTGTLVNVSITAGTGGDSLLRLPPLAQQGIYTLGAVSFTAGPNTAEKYPVTVQASASQAFNFNDAAGDSPTGVLHWSFVQDNTPNPTLFGTMTVLTSEGGGSSQAPSDRTPSTPTQPP